MDFQRREREGEGEDSNVELFIFRVLWRWELIEVVILEDKLEEDELEGLKRIGWEEEIVTKVKRWERKEKKDSRYEQ